jgi:spermidine synthase
VRETLDAKTLYFSYTEIQSRMNLRQPDALALDYTRTMMGFVLFKPAPERVALIGLGGGSMAKWIHRHLPRTALVAVEINPHVIALRDTFKLPPDDARLQVHEADGADFVARTEQRFDVLLIDAFNELGTVPALSSQRFFDDCIDVLQPGGLMVINMHHGHTDFDLLLERIRRSCEGHLLRVDDLGGSNVVVFARRGEPMPMAVSGTRPKGVTAAAWKELGPAVSRITHAMGQGD